MTRQVLYRLLIVDFAVSIILILKEAVKQNPERPSQAYKQGSDKLEKLVTEAMQDAHLKSTDHMRIKMQGLSKDLGLPPGLM